MAVTSVDTPKSPILCVVDRPLNEIVFLVEDAPEGGYTARALGESISPKRTPKRS